jgi:hypothetical protein
VGRLARSNEDRRDLIVADVALIIGSEADDEVVDAIWALVSPEVFTSLTKGEAGRWPAPKTGWSTCAEPPSPGAAATERHRTSSPERLDQPELRPGLSSGAAFSSTRSSPNWASCRGAHLRGLPGVGRLLCLCDLGARSGRRHPFDPANNGIGMGIASTVT